MLSFFRINDPLRLIGVFIIFIIIRIVFFFQIPPILIPELNWLIIGEKLGGGAIMYVDVWDNIAPFSALVYWILYEIVGNSLITYHILAMTLVFIQAAVFNQMLLKKNMYSEKNYLPALLYVLFSCSSFDMLTLSPPLLSLTFLLLVIRNILSLSENAFDNEIFKTGLYLGIAILLYLPSFVFIAFIALGFTLFRTASIRQYLLFVYGISFVFSLVVLYYLWIGGLDSFLQNYLFTVLNIDFSSHLSWQTLVIVMFVPTLFLVFGLMRVFAETAFINFQSNTQLLLLIWLATALLTNLFATTFATYQLILLAPTFSLFVTYFFLLYKKRFLKELLFFILLIGTGLSGYWSCFPLGKLRNYVSYSAVIAKKPADFTVSNKRILVLGKDKSYYYGNQMATPYLNWELSQAHFANLEYYSGMVAVYENLQKDMPEVIIDDSGVGNQIFSKIPILQGFYTQKGNLYFLKKK
ncbi:MAG: hypothetical protein EAZ08_01180 [Cytophagales bacterium]|nr:MAG: hypothetical protein EAZ08_01180 [Cytophagales bacterium]